MTSTDATSTVVTPLRRPRRTHPLFPRLGATHRGIAPATASAPPTMATGPPGIRKGPCGCLTFYRTGASSQPGSQVRS